MKIRVSRDHLIEELAYISPVVDKSAKMPILTHILFDASAGENKLSLTGSDLDITIQTQCPAQVEEEGKLALPARELVDLVRYIPAGEEMLFTSDEHDRVNIRAGKNRSRIVSLPHDTFPDIPRAVEGRMLELPGGMLRKMIQMTSFCTTTEQSRFTLSGVLMALNRNFIKMVATDGHRMAYVETIKPFEELETEIKILIAKKTAAEIARLLQGKEIPVSFGYDENHLFFLIERRMLIARVLTGNFPNYDMVIPRNLKHRLTLDVQQFKMSVQRINVMTDDSSRRIVCHLKEGSMQLVSETSGKGEGEDINEIQYSGEPLELGFNSQYLLEYLNVLETPQVLFEFTDDETAGLFRPAGELDYLYKYVVMPMST